jgi:hypothetical protein
MAIRRPNLGNHDKAHPFRIYSGRSMSRVPTRHLLINSLAFTWDPSGHRSLVQRPHLVCHRDTLTSGRR